MYYHLDDYRLKCHLWNFIFSIFIFFKVFLKLRNILTSYLPLCTDTNFNSILLVSFIDQGHTLGKKLKYCLIKIVSRKWFSGLYKDDTHVRKPNLNYDFTWKEYFKFKCEEVV